MFGVRLAVPRWYDRTIASSPWRSSHSRTASATRDPLFGARPAATARSRASTTVSSRRAVTGTRHGRNRSRGVHVSYTPPERAAASPAGSHVRRSHSPISPVCHPWFGHRVQRATARAARRLSPRRTAGIGENWQPGDIDRRSCSLMPDVPGSGSAGRPRSSAERHRAEAIEDGRRRDTSPRSSDALGPG